MIESQFATIEAVPEAVSDVHIPEALIYEMVDGKPIYVECERIG